MNRKIHITYGLSTAIALIVAAAITYFAKINFSGNIQMFIVVGTIIVGVIASCNAFKKTTSAASNNEVFFNGFRTTAIIALFIIAIAFIFIILVPSFKNTQIENFRVQEIKAANNDATLLKEVEINVADYKKRFTTMFIGINMMIIVISGLVGSAIGTIVNKNK